MPTTTTLSASPTDCSAVWPLSIPTSPTWPALVSLHGGGLGAPLLEALEAQLAELPEVVIVLDDLHHLSNSTLIADLGSLAHLVPPNIHLVLSTRTDLPIAWSRHRLNQELIEIRQADLALDDADSALLLEHITGRSLGADRVAALVARTEGWAAGLQLAGMTLRLYNDSDEFITQFSGDDRLIADYLSEEVLHSLPDDRRELLLSISVLDTMCADLVTHLTDEPNAQLVLDQLERESMFLVSLDTRRQWFRFHHLFRDMLRFTLRAEHPAREPDLLTRAASWHLERGEVDAGVEYLLGARNWTEALEVIMTRGSEVFERGEMATVIRWISQVPESARKGRRDVSLLFGNPQGTGGTSGQRRGHPWASGDRPRSHRRRAGVCTGLPRFPGPVAVPPRCLHRHGCPRPRPAQPRRRRTNPRLHESDTPSVSRDGDRFVLWAWHICKPEQSIKLGTGSTGDWQPEVRRIRSGRSVASAPSGCWRPGAAIPNEPSALSDEALAIAREVGLLAHPSAADAYLASALAALERGEPGRASLSLHEGTLRAEANRRSQLSWFGHLEGALLQEADGRARSGDDRRRVDQK